MASTQKTREESIKQSPDRRERSRGGPEKEARRLGRFALRADRFGGARPPSRPRGAQSAGGGGGEVSWRYRSEHCQGLLWGRSLMKG